MNRLKHNPYKIFNKTIGHGSFGIVKLGIHEGSGTLVAVKTEAKTKKSVLKEEYDIIKNLNLKGLSYFWEDSINYYLAMDLMGPSIDSLHKLCKRKFTLKTTLILANQMIDQVKGYHMSGVVHCDIKLANFLINYNMPHSFVTLIDFGLSKKYIVNGKHIPYCTGAATRGTLRYMSKHVHNSVEYSCRDDLYSLGYCIIFMFTGLLPWQNISHIPKKEQKSYVSGIKNDISNVNLLINCKCPECRECSFQRAMLNYFNYLDSLSFSDSVDYQLLSNLFIEPINSHHIIDDKMWDWNKYYAMSPLSIGM